MLERKCALNFVCLQKSHLFAAVVTTARLLKICKTKQTKKASSYAIILIAFFKKKNGTCFLITVVSNIYSRLAEILPVFKMRQNNIISYKAFITTRGKKIANNANVEGES